LDNQQRTKAERALIAWAVGALARWAGIDPGKWPLEVEPWMGEWLSEYGRLLSPEWGPDGKGDGLQAIFSLVRPEGEPPRPTSVAARPLSLETLLPGPGVPPEELWRGFAAGFERLSEGGLDLERFTHLFQKYAWAVACTYREPGISLYEEFKVLTALIYASGGADRPAERFLLIGGDIPGIQDFLYTLTSKGATKGLRGRSFFLQLLGDGVVRALRRELGGLPEANVVYAAGGNFVLLAPAGSEAVLEEWQTEFNRSLLKEFEGDLYLALAWEELPASAVRRPDFTEVRERLGARIAAAKARRFAEVIEEDGWDVLFEPKGLGGEECCQVCQREPRREGELSTETTEAGEEVRKCGLCRSFEALAGEIAYDSLRMVVAEADDVSRQDLGWRGLLARLTGFVYRFERDRPQPKDGETVYVLNRTDLEGVHGFRFLANVTPRITDADRRWVREHHPDYPLPPGERIKDFGLMALQSEGIQRVGVLRMDVDNLGRVFGEYLRGSMAQVSALSAAMDLFFAGHLNRACDEAGAGRNALYVIYAGGDDLFIVGSWDLMPMLAERIREDFTTYTDRNPHLTLSGGVTLEGRKFPLYRAAERAGEAEEQAKHYTRADGLAKDAFCFLGQVVGWEEWNRVSEQKDNLLWLIGEDEENRVKSEEERQKRLPRALLQVVQSLYHLYRTGLRDARRRVRRENRKRPADKKLPLPRPQMFYGRWAWMQAYSLARLARRSKDNEMKARLMELQKALMQPTTVRYSGLAARWAEYLTRGTERQKRDTSQ